MKVWISFLLSLFASAVAGAKGPTFTGSTPAHILIRNFLEISTTDSIDFIRWKLEIDSGNFQLQCKYGLAQPGTPGFSNEQSVTIVGQLTKRENHYYLKHKNKSISLLEVNANLFHFLDGDGRMLTGNGGYSYALNSTHPVLQDGFKIRSVHTSGKNPQVYEGRTPCSELSALLGLNKSEACNKMKWYFLFYTDSVTGKPSYFLMSGMGYRKDSMARGHWQMKTDPNGHIIYQVYFDQWIRPLNLLKGDDNILFFTDANGRLLVGNENFSYTLNRRKEAYTPSR